MPAHYLVYNFQGETVLALNASDALHFPLLVIPFAS
jgi:hypothetical protein